MPQFPADISESIARDGTELELISATCAAGVEGLKLALQLGLKSEAFSNPAVIQIFAALLRAETNGVLADKAATGWLIISGLRDAKLWNEGGWDLEGIAGLFHDNEAAEGLEKLPRIIAKIMGGKR